MYLTLCYANYAPYEHMMSEPGRGVEHREPGPDELIQFELLPTVLQDYTWANDDHASCTAVT